MILYQALYNSMIWESDFATISIHRTRQGARDALAKVVKFEHEKHNRIYNYDTKEMPYLYGFEFQAWSIQEIQLLE